MNIDVVQEIADFFKIDRQEAMTRLENSYQYYLDDFNANVGNDQSDFAAWYKRATEWYQTTDAQIYEQTYCRYFLTLRSMIDKFVSLYNGRVLDFGCGVGRVGLRALRLKQCESVDFLDNGLTKDFVLYLLIIRGLLGTVSGTGKVVNAPTGKYDTIVVSHVLEHIENPVETVKWLKTFLSSDSGMFIGDAPFHGESSPSHIKKLQGLTLKEVFNLAGVPENQLIEIDFRNGSLCEKGEYE
jgi:SAM-dependent methyltransferase